MGQRLKIASALLAGPRTLILNEPVNGVDPELHVAGSCAAHPVR